MHTFMSEPTAEMLRCTEPLTKVGTREVVGYIFWAVLLYPCEFVYSRCGLTATCTMHTVYQLCQQGKQDLYRQQGLKP